MYDYLRRCLEGNAQPDDKEAFQAVYPKMQYDNQKLRLANSDLLKLLEHFLVYTEKFADPGRNKIQLAGIYRKRNLPKHAQATLREARKNREGQQWRHAEYYEDLQQIEIEAFQAASLTRRYEAFNLQGISDLLDATYIARKLRHVCFARSHQAVVKTDYHFGLLEAIFQHVELEGLLQEPAIALYYHGCHFLADAKAEEHFFKFRGDAQPAHNMFSSG